MLLEGGEFSVLEEGGYFYWRNCDVPHASAVCVGRTATNLNLTKFLNSSNIENLITVLTVHGPQCFL